ncbi:hypothetical protein BSKO_00134 [Bryopsis sp. KO-2023]|nr:hypothetical protein BSKO_00134 [Bryopsis sp. KO-2023]
MTSDQFKKPSSLQRLRLNQDIHALYLRQDFTECLDLIDEHLRLTDPPNEYAIHVKALIKRQQGKIQESLLLFQEAVVLNPRNVCNLKQVGRSLYLLGKNKAALEVYEEAQRIGVDDWEIWHNKGLSYMYLKKYDQCIECFERANKIQPHDSTYSMICKVHAMQDDFGAAINANLEALEHSPENPELLSNLGLLYLRTGENFSAFDYLGRSLSHDPKNPKTILAAGSIMQDHSDMDVALVKYRIASVQIPDSPQLWNNIGMCFFGKQKYIAAMACLKKALYLGPFEWIIGYNLGLVHLHTGQYAGAFHFFSMCINLKPDFAHSYMYLAVTLSKLDDFENACSVYERALELEDDYLFHLNFAITLCNNGEIDGATNHFKAFQQLFSQLDEEAKSFDPDVQERSRKLGMLIKSSS